MNKSWVGLCRNFNLYHCHEHVSVTVDSNCSKMFSAQLVYILQLFKLEIIFIHWNWSQLCSSVFHIFFFRRGQGSQKQKGRLKHDHDGIMKATFLFLLFTSVRACSRFHTESTCAGASASPSGLSITRMRVRAVCAADWLGWGQRWEVIGGAEGSRGRGLCSSVLFGFVRLCMSLGDG